MPARSSASRSFEPVTATLFRQTLGQFASGVTVIAAVNGRPVGFACQSFFSVSLEPPLVGFAVSKASRSWPQIRDAGVFCVSVLSAADRDVCRTFAASGGDKFASVKWHPAATGSPRVAQCLAYIDCEIGAVHDAGDHLLVIGRVVEMGRSEAAPPLICFGGEFGAFDTESTGQ